jgi:superfamily II DNA or RNA helicase
MEEVAGQEMSATKEQDWPTQISGVQGVIQAIQEGERRICLTSPTGGGKSRMMIRLLEWIIAQRMQSVLYTNRKMLLDQISEDIGAANIDHGIRASEYDDEREKPVQVSSIQTEVSRVYKKKSWKLHPAQLVLIDEAHLHTGASAQRIMADHEAQGAVIVGVTATPLDLGGLYNRLVIAGKTSDLRACGALVPAYHYGPDEPDCRHIKRQASGEYSEEDVKKVIMTQTIFARVLDWWKKLNPEQKPTLLFAPGVPESLWFAEQFFAEGIRAAHIDGDECWLDGEYHKSSRAVRKQIVDGSREGSIKVVCNRFVLREGINMPWLAHGIFATVFGTIKTYLQSGGRLLRKCEGKDSVIIQDHGGAWHRHGSLNADRHWELGQTCAALNAAHEDGLRNKAKTGEREPVRCPSCAGILMGTKCRCGFEIDLRKKSRPVIQADGSIQEYAGDIFKPRVTRMMSDTEREWTSTYWRCRKTGKTFKQAKGLFFREHGYWPPDDLPYMPFQSVDDSRRIEDVEWNRVRRPPKPVDESEKQATLSFGA